MFSILLPKIKGKLFSINKSIALLIYTATIAILSIGSIYHAMNHIIEPITVVEKHEFPLKNTSSKNSKNTHSLWLDWVSDTDSKSDDTLENNSILEFENELIAKLKHEGNPEIERELSLQVHSEYRDFYSLIFKDYITLPPKK